MSDSQTRDSDFSNGNSRPALRTRSGSQLAVLAGDEVVVPSFSADLYFLALKNFNLFVNEKNDIEFSVKKGEKVQADFSSFDKDMSYDVRAIYQQPSAESSETAEFIRLSFSVGDGDDRQFFSGALYGNRDKTDDKHPDWTGVLNLTNQKGGPNLRLAAWLQNGPQAGDYFSVSISKFKPKEEAVPAQIDGGRATQRGARPQGRRN